MLGDAVSLSMCHCSRWEVDTQIKVWKRAILVVPPVLVADGMWSNIAYTTGDSLAMIELISLANYLL